MRRLPLVDRLRDTDPELFARYILDRLGTSQRAIHAETARRIAAGQGAGFVRSGDPQQLAAMVLLIAQSAVQSAPLVAEWLPDGAWRAELAHALRGYLGPRPRRRDRAHRRAHAAAPRRSPPRGAHASSRRSPTSPTIDVLVIGGGVTGAGIALDAASRGLRTVLVERHDLAHGTSRWSSKLVHGGLRYLASGQVGIAHESAVERHLLLTRIAPHLTRPLAQVVPLLRAGPPVARRIRRRSATASATACAASSARRTRCSPRPGPIGRDETLRLAPAVRAERPARRRARLGRPAHRRRAARRRRRADGGRVRGIRPHPRRGRLGRRDGGDAARRADRRGRRVRARAVVSATGVWAGELDPDVRLRPSRGTHLVVSTARLGGSDVSLTVPVPGSTSRFVFTLPALHGRTYIGLTDVPADGPIPDVPHATEAEIDMLLATVNTVLADPLDRGDVLGDVRRPPSAAGGCGRRRDERPLAPPRDHRVADRACSASSAASSRRIDAWRRTPSTP